MTAQAKSSTREARVERVEQHVRDLVQSDPEWALRKAKKLHQEARDAKYEADHKRREARRTFAAFEAFKRNLEALGISVLIDETSSHQSPQRRTSDSNKEQDSTP